MAIRLPYIIVYEILILFQMTDDNKTKMIGYEAARSCALPKKPDFLMFKEAMPRKNFIFRKYLQTSLDCFWRKKHIRFRLQHKYFCCHSI